MACDEIETNHLLTSERIEHSDSFVLRTRTCTMCTSTYCADDDDECDIDAISCSRLNGQSIIVGARNGRSTTVIALSSTGDLETQPRAVQFNVYYLFIRNAD